VTNITANAATINGNVTNDGGSTITERGVCWKTSSNPTINDNKISEGKGTGPFTSSITGLMPKTTYYVKAFTTNSNGTAYSNQLSFTTAIPSVTISTQQWTLNNLDVTTYRNGDIIPQVTDNAQWAGLTTGAWCYYNNDSANGAVYGKLYNWYAVNDARGLAPLGWHIPSKEEWITLTTFLGGDGLAGGKMKATTLWNSPNTGATNESGFTGLPGGYRDGTGPSITIGNNGRWWTTKEHDSTTAVERSLGYNIGDCYMYYLDKRCGMSVRCVKD
jgi:uncharacterized protein (TIGR02145 family)